MDWGVFWSVFVVMFVMVPLFFVWAFALVDLFGRRDLGGVAKVAWLLFILFLPLLGTLFYYLFRPTIRVDEVPELASERAGYVAEKLTQLTELRDKGVITEEDFEKQKRRLLAA